MKSSIQKNVLFNYFGQFYITFIGILILPMFLNYLGSEPFGLIAFFALLQSWLKLLDLGMSPTLAREVAYLRMHSNLSMQLRSVVRSLEVVFIVIAIAILLITFLFRNLISARWLHSNYLDLQTISICVGIVSIIISVRWIGSFYRSGINAYEQQVWMNIFDIIFATLKSPLALLVVIITDGNIIYYFSYQLFIVIVEQSIIALKFYTLLPRLKYKYKLFSIVELKRIAPFALSVAYTSGIWIFTTQLDKLILSKTLTLSEFGYFTLVATVASGLAVLSSPISKAVLPRMTALLSKDQELEMLTVYKLATRLVSCIIAPITIILSYYAEEVIIIWTGNFEAASWIAPIMPLYIIGNGLIAILAFQYYLQYAHGKLDYHVKYNTFYALITIPAVVFATISYGPKGAGYVWLISQLMTLLIWVPFIHRKFSPGMHLYWLIYDVLLPISTAILLTFIFVLVLPDYFPDSRVMAIIFFIAITCFSISFCIFLNFFSYIRKYIHARL